MTRDPNAVLRDVRCGWVTIQHAKEMYGVIISKGKVDVDASDSYRKKIQKRNNHKQSIPFYRVGKKQEEFEALWTDENYLALTKGLATLPVTWRFFAKHRVFEHLASLPVEDSARSNGRAVDNALRALKKEFPDLTRENLLI